MAIYSLSFLLIMSLFSFENSASELKIPIRSDLRSLDPQLSYTEASLTVIDQIYEGLFEFQIEGSSTVLKPLLAVEVPVAVPSIDKNGEKRFRYKFELRKGVKFHDDICFPKGKGRELESDDIIYAFKRMCDPAVNSPLFSIFCVIDGVKEFRGKISKLRKQGSFNSKQLYDLCGDLKGIVKTGKYSFDLIFKKSSIMAFNFLASKFICAVPYEAVDFYDGKNKKHFSENPVGTGPYLIDWTKTNLENLKLSKNKKWWGEGAAIETLKFIKITEHVERKNKLLNGEISFLNISKDLDFYEKINNRNLVTIKNKAPSIKYIFFNMNDSTVGNDQGRNLRKALSLVTDITELIDSRTMFPAQSPLPPGLPGYDEKYRNPMLKNNIIEAKKFLERAGFKNGIDPSTGKPLELTFTFSTYKSKEDDFSKALSKQWKRLGINLILEGLNYNEFYNKIKSGKFQISYWGWHADYPDPENFYFLLSSENAPTPNFSMFSNKKFDQVFKDLKDPFLRKDKTYSIKNSITKLNNILEIECPWIPIYNDVLWTLKNKNLKNFHFNPYNRCFKNLSFQK